MTVAAPTVGTLIENAAAATTLSVPYPATTSTCLLLLGVSVKNATPPTVPAGYTSIAAISGTGSTLQPGIMLAYKTATGSETGNLSVTTPNAQSAGQLWAIEGVDLTNPLNVAISTKDQTTATTTTQIPALTTGSDGCLLAVFGANNTNTSTATPPTNFTETADRNLGQQTIEFAYLSQSNAGGTGTETITWSGSGKSLGVLLALNPRVSPTEATGTGVANNATISSTSNPAATEATGTGVANDATVAINNPHPAGTTGTGAALDATVTTLGSIVAATPAGTEIVPGVPVRIRAVWNGQTFPIWRGFVDSWEIGYDPTSPNFAAATVQATDGTKLLALYDRPAVDPTVGGAEDTGTRIGRILDSASWSASARDLDTGDSTLQATDLSGNAWTEALDAAQDEAGELFINAENTVVFRHRRAVLEDIDKTTPVATFGDQTGELPLNSVDFVYNDDLLFNIVGATRVDGDRQESRDPDSIGRYMARPAPEQYGMLLEDDTDVLNWTGYLLSLSKNPEQRVSQITVKPRRDGSVEAFQTVLGLQYGQRIRVNWMAPDPSGAGDGLRNTQDCFIRGIQHAITPQGDWTVSFTLQSATTYRFFTIGDSELGKLGDLPFAF